MTRITITVDGKAHDLPDGCLPALQVQVDRNNAAAKTLYTLGDWLTLHLQEIAIADDLGAAIEQLRKQQETDANAALEAAVTAARAQLLASLSLDEKPRRR